MLDKIVFDACFAKWNNPKGENKSWDDLAKQFYFESGEKLRDKFRKQLKKQGISRENNEVIENNNNFVKNNKNNAKILLMDIETTPLLAFAWGLYDQNISYKHVVEDWHLICWSAKWLFSPDVMSDVLSEKEAKKHDDKRISESMWKLLDEADIIVAHNGNSFDLKKLNSRFIKNGLMSPKQYQTVDTLLVARNNFGFTSNKLDDLCTFFGFGGKTDTDFELWRNCFFGDPEALQKMLNYNINDSYILEEIYLKLRPWIKGHPNLNLWSEEETSVCPNCGGKVESNGNYFTPTGRYDSFRCTECGALGRSRKLNLEKEKRNLIIRN